MCLITGDGDCCHEIKRCLLLGRKAMTNLDSILKSRDITLLPKVCIVKAMVFPVIMYGYKSGTIKKAECWRTDAFELCCWRRLLKSPMDSKKIKLVHPKGDQFWIFGRTDAEAEPPILWPTDVKNWLTGKDPDTGEDWRHDKKGTTEDEMIGMVSPTRCTWVWASSRSWWRTGKPAVLQSMGLQRVRHDWVNRTVYGPGTMLITFFTRIVSLSPLNNPMS